MRIALWHQLFHEQLKTCNATQAHLDSHPRMRYTSALRIAIHTSMSCTRVPYEASPDKVGLHTAHIQSDTGTCTRVETQDARRHTKPHVCAHLLLLVSDVVKEEVALDCIQDPSALCLTLDSHMVLNHIG